MLEKLEDIKLRWEEVERELSNPSTLSDMKRFATLNKEYKDLGKIVDEYKITRMWFRISKAISKSWLQKKMKS